MLRGGGLTVNTRIFVWSIDCTNKKISTLIFGVMLKGEDPPLGLNGQNENFKVKNETNVPAYPSHIDITTGNKIIDFSIRKANLECGN